VNAKAVYMKYINERSFMRLQNRNMAKKRPGGGSGKTQNHLNIYNKNLCPPKCLKIYVKKNR
jgi:hypothetical protein